MNGDGQRMVSNLPMRGLGWAIGSFQIRLASAFLWRVVPIMLATFLVVDAADVSPATRINSIGLALLVAMAQLRWACRDGAKLFVSVTLSICSLGSLGMALGTAAQHRPMLECCVPGLSWNILLTLPVLLMCVFCITGSYALDGYRIRFGRIGMCRGWVSLPAMLLGMGLAGRYLAGMLVPWLSPGPAAFWAMFAGMTLGHLLEHLILHAARQLRWRLRACAV